ncbi:uncharacterized protein I206_107248 [Kwoniella pini CBS 10737]|uniref:Uncharacterized protein n=1 Tax=Kwoniella pini CBS 10737 TaxID=1296096 RepID=A0A1B9HYR4_9TREE|nr:uncharacterized protein I206_05207 [Kwoniella pini CBS 10737]OCF48429.1 hypothetical protein I206_05207 [Kwoniella pini CBS 10737]
MTDNNPNTTDLWPERHDKAWHQTEQEVTNEHNLHHTCGNQATGGMTDHNPNTDLSPEWLEDIWRPTEQRITMGNIFTNRFWDMFGQTFADHCNAGSADLSTSQEDCGLCTEYSRQLSPLMTEYGLGQVLRPFARCPGQTYKDAVLATSKWSLREIFHDPSRRSGGSTGRAMS